MLDHSKRIGRFTSSEIYRCIPGKQGMKRVETYVNEKAMEIVSGRIDGSESNAKPLVWGRVAEQWAFGNPRIFGTNYNTSSQDTVMHTELPWSGSRDGIKLKDGQPISVFDLKCPYKLDSYYKFLMCKNIGEVVENHNDGEKYYWQLVSNAILSGVNHAELIVAVPTKEELADIRLVAEGMQAGYFIMGEDDEALPYIDSPYIPNALCFGFDIPQGDVERLTTCVTEAAIKLADRVEFMKESLKGRVNTL